MTEADYPPATKNGKEKTGSKGEQKGKNDKKDATENTKPHVETSPGEPVITNTEARRTLRGCLQEASRYNFDEGNDEIKRFEKSYKDSFLHITNENEDEENIIHYYIREVADMIRPDRPWDEVEREKFLIWILKYHTGLFTHRPSELSKRNPLQFALLKNNGEVVEIILKYLEEIPAKTVEGTVGSSSFIEARSMLTQRDGQQQICLDLAVQRNSKYAERLIDLYLKFHRDDAKNTPFERPDDQGFTPLHRAVQAFNGKVEVIVNLTKTKPELDLQVSPNSYAKQQTSVARKLVQAHKSSLKKPPGNGKDSKDKLTPYKIRETEIRKKIKNEWDGWSNHHSDSLTPEVNQELEKQLKLEARKVCMDDPILEIIRLEVLRSDWDRKTMIECLYSTGNERHIEFSLAGFPRPTISEEYLEKLAKHLSFESVLVSVNLPALRAEPQWTHGSGAYGRLNSSSATERLSQTKSMTTTDDAAVGINDFIIIFKWLRKHHVRRIIKVVVVDDRDPPHSDEAIETALEDFKIELWDWKRLDTSSDVIMNVSRDIRAVSLYWSGNKSTLMGWASEDGFRNAQNFPNLSRIQVYFKTGLETHTRRQKYLDYFERKLKSACVDMSTQTEDATDTPQGDNDRKSANGHLPFVETVPRSIEYETSPMRTFISELGSAFGGQRGNKWLRSMDDIIKVVNSIPMTGTQPVKIAIIDDGVDAALDKFDNKIAAGASFSSEYGQDDPRPYFVSSSHHGTMMASLISDLCPWAKLYVAKLEERYSGRGSSHITPKSAAEAVRWAVGCGVDIISMSWSMESSIQDEGINSLEEELRVASDHGRADSGNKPILMFCSNSDQGASTKPCFPAKSGKCIKVGAATSTGEKLTWVGDDIDILFPGENISFTPIEGGPAINKPGSSVSTALASGYASLVLCLERIYKENKTPKMEMYKSVQDKEQMGYALEYLASTFSGGKPFPGAEKLKNLVGKDWRKPRDKSAIIEELGFVFRSISKKAG